MEIKLVSKAIVINDKNEILIVRRSKTAPRRALQWDLPGGMVEEGEHFAAATARETQEETGIVLDPEHFNLVYTHTGVAYEWSVIWMFYAGKTDAGKVTLSYEHDQYKWLPLEKAIGEFEYPLHRDVLQYLAEHNILDNLPL